jgi:hypothetical protein
VVQTAHCNRHLKAVHKIGTLNIAVKLERIENGLNFFGIACHSGGDILVEVLRILLGAKPVRLIIAALSELPEAARLSFNQIVSLGDCPVPTRCFRCASNIGLLHIPEWIQLLFATA